MDVYYALCIYVVLHNLCKHMQNLKRQYKITFVDYMQSNNLNIIIYIYNTKYYFKTIYLM